MDSTASDAEAQPSHEREALCSIRLALAARLGVSAQRVRCEFRRGELVLSGLLQSFYQKQLAQESVFSTGASCRVHNRIAVDDSV